MTVSAPFLEGAPQVAILGGTGFVGRALIETWPAALRPPRVLVHRSLPDWLAGSGAIVQRIDLVDLSDARQAFAGCDVLVNLLRPDGAGWYPDLLRRLLPYFGEADLRRCVHASSIDVYAGSSDHLVNEDTSVCPISPYEIEHWEAERLVESAFSEVVILRLGAIFGQGGRNIVSFAREMACESVLKLALRRALYGERRMHLVSVGLVARAFEHFCVDARIDRSTLVLLTQDDDPKNNFGFVQDTLAESFGRDTFRKVPILPPAALRLALRLRGAPRVAASRRFSTQKIRTYGLTTDGFTEALQAYARLLAMEFNEPGI